MPGLKAEQKRVDLCLQHSDTKDCLRYGSHERSLFVLDVNKIYPKLLLDKN